MNDDAHEQQPPINRPPPEQASLGLGNPLRPELYKFVRLERGPADMRMFMLDHPLLSIEISDFNECHEIHDALDEAFDALDEEIEGGNWRDVIYRHDERYRVKAFCEYAHLLPDRDYWSLLGDLYREYQADRTLSDAFPENLVFHKLLQSQRPGRVLLMDENDREFFARLPNSFTVYRGFARGDGTGISWTPDRRVALFFAHLEWERCDGKHRPMVTKAVVKNRSSVYAYFSKENEVLVPMDSLTALSTDDVTSEQALHPHELSFDFDAWASESARTST